jgi:hypothetical protein
MGGDPARWQPTRHGKCLPAPKAAEDRDFDLTEKSEPMHLTIDQAASRLGKSARQVRYMILNGRLPARKIAGRWSIDAADLPLSDGQRATLARRDRALRSAVEEGLGLEPERAPRYSVRDLKAFQIALPLERQAAALLGPEHPAAQSLRRALELLAQGCHRFESDAKATSYRAARDAASQAVCELVVAEQAEAEPLIQGIEQDLMAAFAGLLRRLARRQPR